MNIIQIIQTVLFLAIVVFLVFNFNDNDDPESSTSIQKDLIHVETPTQQLLREKDKLVYYNSHLPHDNPKVSELPRVIAFDRYIYRVIFPDGTDCITIANGKGSGLACNWVDGDK